MDMPKSSAKGNLAADSLICPRCHTLLPSRALFCSSCGGRVETSNPTRSDWLWPAIIILSAVVAGLLNIVFADTVIRPVVVFWFLFVCPGMTLVRFFSLKEPVMEWTLAVALSFAIDGLVASIQLYAGRWSSAGTLSILIGFSLVGAIVQLAPLRWSRRTR